MPRSSEATEAQVALPAAVDLHARPAANFVREAMRFSSSVFISADGREVDAKSLLSVLSLGAKGGTTLGLRAVGEDADAAIDVLATTLAQLRD